MDSLENITHSLCTLEFESRRASYYWLLEARRPQTLLAPALLELVQLLLASTAPMRRHRPRALSSRRTAGAERRARKRSAFGTLNAISVNPERGAGRLA